MKIEIHIRDSQKNGKRIGLSGMCIESHRVYAEPGDGARMGKFALPLLAVATSAVKNLIKEIKSNSVGALLPQS